MTTTEDDLLGLRNMSTASASSFFNYTLSLAARGAEEDFYRDWQIAELSPPKLLATEKMFPSQ